MNDRHTLEAAVERILYSIIKLFIDLGITVNHFIAIARRIYVKVAKQKLEQEVAAQRNSVEVAISEILRDAGKTEEEIEHLRKQIDRYGGPKAALRRALKTTDIKEGEIDRAVEALPMLGKVTSTRMAMMTGVPRKDIPDLLNESIEDVADDQWYRHRCGQVLSKWWRTADFTDDDGMPVILMESDELAARESEKVSFESLVESCGKQLSYRALLEELEATQCIERVGEGKIRVLKERYEREGLTADSLTAAADRLYSLAEAINSQLRSANPDMMEGAVFSLQVPAEKMAILLRRLNAMTETYLRQAERAMKQNESKDGEEGTRIGVGAYTFKGDEMAESEMFASTTSEIQKVSNE